MTEKSFKICGSFSADSIWDSNFWPISDIPSTNTINKTRAKKSYHLGGDHLAGVKSTHTRIQTFYGMTPTYIYSERDVERLAWEVYGGPNGLRARQSQAPGFRALWLSDAKAAAYKEKCRQRQQVGTTPSFDVKYQPTAVSLKGTNTHSQYHPVNHCIKPKFYDEKVIELSSDDEFPNTSTLSQNYAQAQPSSPTAICTRRGKKRYREEDVIVISDDEESTSQAKKRRRYP